MAQSGKQHHGSTQTSVLASDTYMPKDKLNLPAFEAEARYGKEKQPVPATQVFYAPITKFSAKDTKAEKWIVINEKAGTMTFINTYDGKTGAGYDMLAQTQPLDAKRLQGKIKDGGYVQKDIDECPVAVTIEQAEKAKIKDPAELADDQLDASEGSARVSADQSE